MFTKKIKLLPLSNPDSLCSALLETSEDQNIHRSLQLHMYVDKQPATAVKQELDYCRIFS